MSDEQLRMSRLQLLNWGTFSDLHDIPIAKDGFLFVGGSGSGKSTLLDAISALLVPPTFLGFNAAAREGDRGRYDRNLVSYVRGAWADQKDSGSGEIATQYLRPATTFSALALEYTNDTGKTVSLIQLFWLKGSTTRTQDLKRHFMVAERPFEIKKELDEFAKDLDLRRFKQATEDVYHHTNFKPYSERFRRLLQIENEMALKLLHKTQSAKNLSDLNSFLREFMLDKPKTFDVAASLVEEFDELEAAHQSVVTARDQLSVLRPARDDHERLQSTNKQINDLEELSLGVDAYRDECRLQLLENEVAGLTAQDEGLEGQELRQQEYLQNLRSHLSKLEAQHRDCGGDQIEQLERDKSDAEQRRGERLAKAKHAELACQALTLELPKSAESYAELVGKARAEVENALTWRKQVKEQEFALKKEQERINHEYVEIMREVAVMEHQPSNIPARMVELRKQLAQSIGLAEADLPFVGELIEVREAEVEWQGAIERVLHGFALSLLVDERHYAAVSRYVNETRLNGRLVYYRVGQGTQSRSQITQLNAIIHKLELKACAFQGWLEMELKQRFNYVCVDSLRAFRDSERAITREGQIKHGKSRHEKDDRRAINDNDFWVLGFDNRAKLSRYMQKAKALEAQRGEIEQQLKSLEKDELNRETRFNACHTLVNIRWSDIDVTPLLIRIHELQKLLDELRSGNRELQVLAEQISAQKRKVDSAQEKLTKLKAERIDIGKRLTLYREEIESLTVDVESMQLTPFQRNGLQRRFEQLEQAMTLKNIDSQRTQVDRGLNKDREQHLQQKHQLEKIIENRFADFLRRWAEERGDLDATLASATEFFAKLQRLEKDRLPEFEQHFFDLLKNQSTENLAALNTHMNQARKDIRERMEMVNESLAGSEFNPGTYLRIEVSDRHLEAVNEFRKQIQQVVNYAWNVDTLQAEDRFSVLRQIVMQLKGQENVQQRWRELVLDVRLHVEFVGHEYNQQDEEVEIYRSGAGKSGGQREKLATTCLAAALRYQLGSMDGGEPIYASVVLDEAFAKADNEFTELAMKIFTNFGFQMIVATPLKSVMTLEMFIGGACFVDIAERKRSATLPIEYDTQQQRLALPDTVHGEAVVA